MIIKKVLFVFLCLFCYGVWFVQKDTHLFEDKTLAFSASSYYYSAKVKENKICFPVSDVVKKPYCADIVYKTNQELKLKSKYGVQNYVWNKRLHVYTLIQDSRVADKTPKKIAVLYISTGKYIVFWEKFYQEMEKYFLPNHQVTYFLITDHMDLKVPDNVRKVYQQQLPWPYITLKRYHFFMGIEDQLKEFDYVFFLNGTLLPKQKIDEEILPTEEQGIMVALHPGYYLGKPAHFPYERKRKSQAYLSKNEGQYYVAGGLNGGTSKAFLKLSKDIMEMTDKDLQNNIIPVWHDESMLNKYLVEYMKNGKQPLILMPEYLIPEVGYPRLNPFRPYTKFLILEKNIRGGKSYFRQND